jgi:hypothetical protein
MCNYAHGMKQKWKGKGSLKRQRGGEKFTKLKEQQESSVVDFKPEIKSEVPMDMLISDITKYLGSEPEKEQKEKEKEAPKQQEIVEETVIILNENQPPQFIKTNKPKKNKKK